MNLKGLHRCFELEVPPEKFSCYGPLSVVEKLIVTNVAMDSTNYLPEIVFEDSVVLIHRSQMCII